jgi:hypothetical protein
MKPLPKRVNLDHLKKQPKDLIRLYRDGDRTSIARFLRKLPAAAVRKPDEIASLELRLHDAQSCAAREYGFASWTDLKSYVEAQSGTRGHRADAVHRWLAFVYPGDVTGGVNLARPHVAVRVFGQYHDLATSSGPRLPAWRWQRNHAPP